MMKFMKTFGKLENMNGYFMFKTMYYQLHSVGPDMQKV